MKKDKIKYVVGVIVIVLTIAAFIYNNSMASGAKLYISNPQRGSEQHETLCEDEYSVDVYIDANNVGIGGFQIWVQYEKCLRISYAVTGDVDGNIKINDDKGRIIMYSNSGEKYNGKIKLCTIIFEILDDSTKENYDVHVYVNDGYTKVCDEANNLITLEGEKENNQGGGNNQSEENIPKTGEKTTIIFIILGMLILVTLITYIKLKKYKEI